MLLSRWFSRFTLFSNLTFAACNRPSTIHPHILYHMPLLYKFMWIEIMFVYMYFIQICTFYNYVCMCVYVCLFVGMRVRVYILYVYTYWCMYPFLNPFNSFYVIGIYSLDTPLRWVHTSTQLCPFAFHYRSSEPPWKNRSLYFRCTIL